MFAFRPGPIYFDPWSSTYVRVPSFVEEEPTYGTFGPSPGTCFDDYRPYARSHRRPAAAVFPAHQPHFLHNPELYRQAPPSATAFAKAHAAPSYPEVVDDNAPHVDQMAFDALPYASGYPSRNNSRASSARGSLHAGTHPFSPTPEDVRAAHLHGRMPYSREPSPFAAAAAAAHAQQDEGRPCTPASSRSRQCIPVQAVAVPGTNKPPTEREVPVHHHRASAEAANRQQQPQPAVKPVRPSPNLGRAEAATIIQTFWRMRRLARQRSALKVLAASAMQLRSTTKLFNKYKQDSSAGIRPSSGNPDKPSTQQQQVCHLSHKQYLELNELAMGVLLQLDATSCGVAELRAVRKRLTAATIKLLDEIQACHSAAVTASMELSDDVVRAAVHSLAKVAGSAAPAAAPAPAAHAQEQEEGRVSLAQTLQQEQQQQQQQQQHPAHQLLEQVQQQQEAAERQPQPVAHEGEQRLPIIEVPAAGQSEESTVQCAADMRAGPASSTVEVEVEEAATGLSTAGAICNQELLSEQQQEQEQLAVGCLPEQCGDAAHVGLPLGVRVVFVYPGSRADAATQTD